MSKVTVPEGFAVKLENVDPGFIESINAKRDKFKIQEKTWQLLEILPDA